MDTSAEAQQNRRFWLFLTVVVVCIVVSFWTGFNLGRDVEKQEWLELVNPPPEKQSYSS